MITPPLFRFGPYGMMMPNLAAQFALRVPGRVGFGYGAPQGQGMLPGQMNPYDTLNAAHPQNTAQSFMPQAPVNQNTVPDFSPDLPKDVAIKPPHDLAALRLQRKFR